MFLKKKYAVVCEGDSKVRSPKLFKQQQSHWKKYIFSWTDSFKCSHARSSRREYLFLNVICFMVGACTVLEIGFTSLYIREMIELHSCHSLAFLMDSDVMSFPLDFQQYDLNPQMERMSFTFLSLKFYLHTIILDQDQAIK